MHAQTHTLMRTPTHPPTHTANHPHTHIHTHSHTQTHSHSSTHTPTPTRYPFTKNKRVGSLVDVGQMVMRPHSYLRLLTRCCLLTPEFGKEEVQRHFRNR
jgi:hypothetical protein